MKITTRVLSLVLALILAASVLCFIGCDSGNTENPTEASSENKSEEITSSEGGNTTEETTTAGETPEETISVKYDDRITFEKEVASIETIEVLSKICNSDTPDENVVRKLQPTVYVASGVGSCRVKFTDNSSVVVNVEPAVLSVALIIGQSNGEGSTSETDYAANRPRSIACEPGQVYSSYAWSTKWHALYVAGLSVDYYLDVSNAGTFIQTSLTSNKNYKSNTAPYSIKTLTSEGDGKVGLDSGLGYEWTKLTGEKIWIINCAAGSSPISTWVPDGDNFKEAVELMRLVGLTVKREIDAGHITFGHLFYLWLQGESDKDMSETEYYKEFEKVHNGLKESVKWTLKEGEKPVTFEACGIIAVRACLNHTGEADFTMNGPRSAQKRATEEIDDVYFASQCAENWAGGKTVSNYFKTKYPDGFPFTVHGEIYSLPKTMTDVHPDIHYRQPGYNEIGIDCGDNMFAVFYKKAE